MEEVTVSFSSLRLEEEVPILYFNDESYLEKTKEIGEDGEILLWRLKIEEVMTFLLGDRYWRERDDAYFRRGMKEEQTFENESYDAFCREVRIVFCSLEKREDFIAAIFRLSPHLPLVYPFFESIFEFVKYDYVEPFRCYKERGYDMSQLLHYQNSKTPNYSVLGDVVLQNAKKVAHFCVDEGLTTLVDLYTVALRECAIPMIEYLLPLLPPLPRGEKMLIKNEDGSDMAVLAHLLGYPYHRFHKMGKIKEVEFVKKILKKHGGINDRENGKSPLFMAAYHRKDLIIAHLMNHGADVTKEDKIIEEILVPGETNFNLIVFFIGKGAPVTEETKYRYYGVSNYLEGEEFKEKIKKKFGDLFEDPVVEERYRRDDEMSGRKHRIREEFEKRFFALYPDKYLVVPIEEVEAKFYALHPLRGTVPHEELERRFHSRYPAGSFMPERELRAKFAKNRNRSMITSEELEKRIEENFGGPPEDSAPRFERNFRFTFFPALGPTIGGGEERHPGWVETDGERFTLIRREEVKDEDVTILERELARHKIGQPFTSTMLQYVFIAPPGFNRIYDPLPPPPEVSSAMKDEETEGDFSSFSDHSSSSNSGGSLSSSFAGRGRGYQGKNYDPDYARKKRERESDSTTSNSVRGGGYQGRGGNRGRGGYRGYGSDYANKKQKN